MGHLPFFPDPKAHSEVPHPPPAGTSRALPGARDREGCGERGREGRGGDTEGLGSLFPPAIPHFSPFLARWRERGRSAALGAAGAHGPGAPGSGCGGHPVTFAPRAPHRQPQKHWKRDFKISGGPTAPLRRPGAAAAAAPRRFPGTRKRLPPLHPEPGTRWKTGIPV